MSMTISDLVRVTDNHEIELSNIEQKTAVLLYLLSGYYCSYSLFSENVGGHGTVTRELNKCNNVKEIKKFINSYI